MSNIRELEHISLRAWQALETQVYDGWHLRFANGYTGRANSVQALDSSSIPLTEKIQYCENWYAKRNLPCIFRLTTAMQPPELEATLTDCSYERYNETLVQTANLESLFHTTDNRFHSDNTVSDDWLEAWGRWNNVPTQHISTAKEMLSGNTAQSCFGWIDDKAVGLGVYEAGYVGLFDIVVNPTQRQRGLGRALVTSLLAWGQSQGASTAYLQVVANNTPALTLYDKLGFTTHHHYWYRRQRDNVK